MLTFTALNITEVILFRPQISKLMGGINSFSRKTVTKIYVKHKNCGYYLYIINNQLLVNSMVMFINKERY